MFQYPLSTVSQIQVSKDIWWELERRLGLIYLGKSHSSSKVHEMVIKQLEDAGPDSPELERLRNTAQPSRDAVYRGDFKALGQAMITNTEAQAQLHPELISNDAARIFEIASEHDALGWKVNGAGGEGGSLTILGSSHSSVKRAMIREIEAENQLYQSIPIYLSRSGLRTWETTSGT